MISFDPRGCSVLKAESSIGEIALQETGEPELPQIPPYVPDEATRWDVNSIVNNLVLFGVAGLVFLKVAMIDSDVSRGWTVAEIVQHVPSSVWGSYMGVLTEAPIPTKAVTSATVYTIGDVIAQQTEGTSIGELDRMRILRSMLAGLLFHGPMSHVW